MLLKSPMNWLLRTQLAQQIPSNFRVVISLYETKQVAQQLANRRLEGVAGISSSGTIALQWLTVARDAMLAMSGPETLRINDITKVRYDDPEYLMQDNMAALFRIFNQTGIARVLSNIFQYAVVAAKRSGDKNFGQFVYFSEYCAFWQKLAYIADVAPPTINSVEDLAHWLVDNAPKVAKHQQGEWGEESATLSYDQWEYLVHGALKNVSTVYSDEGEWIVNDNVLNIPNGSTLYVVTYDVPDEIMVQWNSEDPTERERLKFTGWFATLERMEELHNIVREYGLDRQYRIRWINEQGFKERRNDYFKRQKEQ